MSIFRLPVLRSAHFNDQGKMSNDQGKMSNDQGKMSNDQG